MSGVLNPALLDPIELRIWTLLPTIVDTPGSQPEHLLDEVLLPRWLGALRKWRTKNVLIYVVSPTGGNAPVPGKQFDDLYIAEQKGHVGSLPLALIRSDDSRIKLNMVVMFATKFDLLDSSDPNKPMGRSSPTGDASYKVENAFRPHKELLETACRKSEIDFHWLIGSAELDFGIRELKEQVEKVIR